MHRRVVQHGIEDLQLCDALAWVITNPCPFVRHSIRNLVGDLAVPFAEKAQEKRTAFVNFFQADLQRLIVFGLLTRHSLLRLLLQLATAERKARRSRVVRYGIA